jgi:hypothetical protein
MPRREVGFGFPHIGSLLSGGLFDAKGRSWVDIEIKKRINRLRAA